MKMLFENKNKIVLNSCEVGDTLLPVPTLKKAAIMAIEEIDKDNTNDSIISEVICHGTLKDVLFANGAMITIPEYCEVGSYKEALQVLVSEIDKEGRV